MAKDEDKKKEGEEDQPPSATILETEKQRDPDEAVFAEQAIHEYANQVLDQFERSLATALDGVRAWVAGLADEQAVDGGAIDAELGEAFLQEMLQACGGKDSPIGAALFSELDGQIDQLLRSEEDASRFVDALQSEAVDFIHYLRDNLQSVLSHEWDQLRDLAYEGSTDFIPLLHALGMPELDWSPETMKAGLIAVAEKKEQAKPKTAEEAKEQDAEEEEKEQDQALLEEEEKAQRAG